MIEDGAVRRELLDALAAGFRENHGTLGACFYPRHEVRASRAGEVLTLEICFQCLQVWAKGTGAEGVPLFISDSPEPTFDRVLTAAGIELAPKH